jgi:uroporphyrinogen III methyltransferase/synthase
MTLTEGLMELGAHVDRIHIYSAEKPSSIDEKLIEEVKKADVVTFTSSSTVTNFFDIVTECRALFASIGPVTTETLMTKGYTPAVTAEEFTIDGLVKALVEYYSK